ncbi:splicing factor 45 isoform X1 [Hydra vulgaris]|uniref:splicing factor 45 isoform X1 n=1 Tax=Hydra vulgaris TaxID=6087 RepID=UPI001F5FE6A8|nr:splicing factor 45 [Hydra vulgaris]
MSLSSLYDGVGFAGGDRDNKGLDSNQMAGWSDNLQFMKTQLQLRKALKVPGPAFKGGKGLSSAGPGTITLSNMSGTNENKPVLVDEYNPLRPNDYGEFKEQAREKEEQERKEREREKDRERREKERSEDSRDDRKRRGGSHERDDSRRRRRDEDRLKDRGRAAIAPPASLLEATPVNPDLIVKKDGAGTGGFQTGNVVASQIMAKYGWKEGQGLGREEQGLSTCLQVEKTGKRAGKIINKDVEKIKNKEKDVPSPPPDVEEVIESNITDKMKNPSKVVLLMNMVGPGEVDDELQPEIEEECGSKYGEINKVLIFEIPDAVEEEAVRIFVEFKRIESAVKALVDLNGRFFGGRSVSAQFYNLDRFRRLDLAG